MNLLIELTKKLRPFQDEAFVLGVSGGLDSMALLQIFLHFRKHFGFQFSVAHFHHGPSLDADQLNYRNQCFEFVRSQCEGTGVAFFSNLWEQDLSRFLDSWQTPLQSEAEFRDARYEFFEQVKKEQGFQKLVLAHHRDDLLETRLIRLIRGTGPEGLQAMSHSEGWILRPLLDLSRRDLQSYLSEKGGQWQEDPSNSVSDPLRNWLRNQWLPDLEAKREGALDSLSRSLHHLVSSLDQSGHLRSLGEQNFLELSQLLTLSEGEKRQVLATYMKGQGLKNYGVSHINEVLKRLDKEQKSFTFQMLGRCWKVDAGRMSLERLS